MYRISLHCRLWSVHRKETAGITQTDQQIALD